MAQNSDPNAVTQIPPSVTPKSRVQGDIPSFLLPLIQWTRLAIVNSRGLEFLAIMGDHKDAY
jgi:hypothetical protein